MHLAVILKCHYEKFGSDAAVSCVKIHQFNQHIMQAEQHTRMYSCALEHKYIFSQNFYTPTF